MRDLVAALRLRRIWWRLGVQDLRLRFRRAALGIGWIFIQLAATLVALGAVYGTLLGQEMRTFLPFLAVGLVLWGFITASVVEGSQAFVASEGYIKQIGLPVQVYVFRFFVSIAVAATMSLSSYVVVVALYAVPIGWGVLWSIPGLFLFGVTAFWLVLIFAHLTARFRDTAHLASTALQILFFVTPVIWPAEMLKGRPLQWVVDANPLYHLLEVARRPLLFSEPATAVNYLVGSGVVVVLGGVALLVVRLYSRRIVYLL
ncbi:MAG: ABC transporter permease [Candidatus Rokuibacteriota bacterium]